MDNILDLLLRELQKTIDNNGFIIISEESIGYKSQIIFYPVSVKYDEQGLYIANKEDNYVWITNPDNYNLYMDDLGDCLEFSFRDKANKRYYGICF